MTHDLITAGPLTLWTGDCLDVLDQIDAESIHACITDPPYHLTSIVKRFGAEGAAAAKVGKTGAYARATKGFMGKEWDGGDIAFRPETWAEMLRVLKPGGHLIAFNHSRTFHRMVAAIEGAGFEVRDTLMWLYGSGFPKSHDISKAIDKLAGAEREVIGDSPFAARKPNGSSGVNSVGLSSNVGHKITAPATPEAAEWQGWGTALKPAFEPIILARKPLAESSIARQCLATGTGALNIDACRLDAMGKNPGKQNLDEEMTVHTYGKRKRVEYKPNHRWPANVVHDGSPEATAGMPTDPVTREAAQSYFFCAKADKGDRRGSEHPTVKPQSLMRWLVRLVTAEGQTVLDPFAGSGATGWAAAAEGRSAILIERDPEYAAHIRRLIDRKSDRPMAPDPSADASPQASLF